LASLIYGVESEMGFTSLIAEPGMGKTTLLYYLLKRYRETARTAFVFETQCSSRELLQHLFAELEIDVGSNDLVMAHNRFKEFLVSQARARRRVLVIFDEAQNLGTQVLETVRLLSNFETSQAKLMHIVLAGQPNLANKLARPELRQLKQRISIFARLKPFTEEETRAYIEHRLGVAGYTGAPLFTPEAYRLIAAESQGIPREINRLCFGALSLGCALKSKTVDEEVVREVGADLQIDLSAEPKASNHPLSAPPQSTPQSWQSSAGFSWSIGQKPPASQSQPGKETIGSEPQADDDSPSGHRTPPSGFKPKIASLIDIDQEPSFGNGSKVATSNRVQSAAAAAPALEFITLPQIRLESRGRTTQSEVRTARSVTARQQSPRPSNLRPALQGAARENALAQLRVLMPPEPAIKTVATPARKQTNRVSEGPWDWMGWLGPYGWGPLGNHIIPPVLLPFLIGLLLYLLVHYRVLLTSAVFTNH
jgi:type II secretory pathway predicted ATPase ExeA